MENIDKKKYEEILEKIIKEFNEKEQLENLESYNIDAVLSDTQNLLKKYSHLIDLKILQKEEIPYNQIQSPSEAADLTSDEIPFDKIPDPLEFIDYLEFKNPKQKSKFQKFLFLLKKYEEENKPTFSICDLSLQDELSQLVFRGDKNFFGSMSYEDKIILSDNFGEVKFYSIKDKKLVRTLPNPTKNKKNKIYAIDINDDGDMAFLGYENGNIALFDLEKNKCQKIFNEIHKTNVINIKIIEQVKLAKEKQFKILSSDVSGNVYLTHIKKGLLGLGYSFKSNLFCQNVDFPFYMIYLLRFKENELKNNSLSKLNQNFILSNLQKVNLYSSSPKGIEKIFDFSKPDYLKDSYISDCAFGLGIKPSSNESSDYDDDDIQILLLISWERVIYLHVLPVLDNNVTFPLLLGYYVNNIPIIRIGFLNLSSIYLIDKEGNFKILDTRKFNQGNIEIHKELCYPIVPKNNSRAELQQVLHFNGIMKQIYLKIKDVDKETYFYSILNNNTKDESSVCVLTDNQIYYQELIDYQKYLKDLQKKENWMGLLILGINIYKGKMAALNGIPFKKKDRKSTIGEYLQDLISQFLFTNAGTQQVLNNSKNNYFDPNQEKARIEKNMDITIEFCIEIDSVNYLFDKILKIYESKKYKEIFLSKLEPFILCDKMKKFDIPEEIILDLIKLYESKKQFDVLGQILIHFNIKSIDTPNIRQKIQNLFLASPFMYICIYGENKDYFKPVTFIYDRFINSKEIPDFTSYKELIQDKKMPLAEVKMSKQYIGHKLLWYIKKTLQKKKFPNFMENIDDDSYCKCTSEITYWLLSDEVLKNLLQFDASSFFEMISFIFGNKEEKKGGFIIETLQDNNDDVKKKEEALKILKPKENSSYNKENIAPKDLVEYLIENFDKYLDKKNKDLIQLHFNIFIVTIGKRLNLEKKVKKEAIKFIIQKYHKLKKEKDQDKSEEQKITNNIKEILNEKEFDDNDYNDILHSMTKHEFDDIRLLINKKKENYKECLEIYLDSKSTLLDDEENIFDFINMTFYNLNKLKENKGPDNIDNFKKIILKNLDLIGAKSIEKFENMISTWFIKEKKQVLEELKVNQDIQLQYVELLVKKLIRDKQENSEIELSEMKEDEQKYIKNFLVLHIKLLCIKKESKKIITFLKQCDMYPIEDCIQICKNYEVIDGLIFLYKKIGSIDKALDVCLNLISKLYKSITDNLNNSKNFQENKCILEGNDFIKVCGDAINILIESEKSLMPELDLSLEKSENGNKEAKQVKEEHKLWSEILDKIYKLIEAYENDTKNIKPDDYRFKPKEDFKKIIQDQFQNLLKVMSRYVGIKYILDIVYKTNKDAKFSEFKPLLFEMLKSYENQKNILGLIRNELKLSCNESIKDLKKINDTGVEFEIENYSCDICKLLFNDTLGINGKILHFPCEHMEHLTCANRRHLCQICLEKEYQDNITKVKKGGDYYEDKIHKEFMNIYEEYKKELTNKEKNKKVKVEKPEKKKNKSVGFTISKKFNRLMGLDNYNKGKKTKLYYGSAASCSKQKELAIEEKNMNKIKK